MSMWDQARICPNCGSTDIRVDDEKTLSMLRLQHGYKCQDCGYAGIFPVVDEENVGDRREEIEQSGSTDDIPTSVRPTKRRVLFGIGFLLVGVPPTLYGTGIEGRLVGILSLAIGGTIVADYLSAGHNVQVETGDGNGANKVK